MTPKEQADDIFKKMKGFGVTDSKARKNAIVAVKEIISTCPQKENEIFAISKGIKHWQDVKSELENKKL